MTNEFTKQMPITLEIPEGFLENILLIPSELTADLTVPIIKVERKLNLKQIRDMIKGGDKKLSAIAKMLDIQSSGYDYYSIPSLKEELIRKDLFLLAGLVASIYQSKIKRDIAYDRLYQVVEIDWSYQELYPGDTEIHYEIFTKREIFIRTEGDK
jgi:hypothetical protein